MSPETLRTLDGPGLDAAAFALGLAPEGVECWEGALYAFVEREPWAPHVNLVQADAMLRSCRARDWDTRLIYEGLLRYGSVTVNWFRCLFAGENMVPIVDADITQITDCEATAIVRAICLAAMSEQTQEGA